MFQDGLWGSQKEVLREAAEKTQESPVEVVVGEEGGQAQEEEEEEGEGEVEGLEEEEEDEGEVVAGACVREEGGREGGREEGNR